MKTAILVAWSLFCFTAGALSHERDIYNACSKHGEAGITAFMHDFSCRTDK